MCNIIAITYFLATLPILTTKITITRYIVIVSEINLKLVALDSYLNSAYFDVFEVYFKQNNKNIIITTILATFYFEIAVNCQYCEFLKNSNWNMTETTGKMHMYDMVKIDIIVNR